MRVPFSGMEIDVESEQTTEHPRVFKDIWITYKLATPAENESKVRKAIDLSLEKYCGVSAMLRKNSPIHYKLELTGNAWFGFFIIIVDSYYEPPDHQTGKYTCYAIQKVTICF